MRTVEEILNRKRKQVTVKESSVEKAVCDYAKGKGFLAYKFTSPQRRSVPDRMFIDPEGTVFFIEFKAPGKEPTDAQVREIDKLRENKAVVFVADTVDRGIQIIDIMLALCE